ncbi:hypothetical protein WB66_11010 [bacteria symbiont BFo1 of Frankliniella occidentalis]|nr:hypothetical protein AI28_08115 [bacteria symbiont BFo1 of Frankliniella occidentalis]KYP84738.1 hypothetical protein WB66_11010 [bacteria symbiont BFo1 of Frankliniella occidentalis]
MTAEIIPIRKPDAIREAYELIDRLADTELSIEQTALVDRALGCIQKAIDAQEEKPKSFADCILERSMESWRHDLISTPEHVKDALWCKHFGLNEAEKGDGETDVLPAK